MFVFLWTKERPDVMRQLARADAVGVLADRMGMRGGA
jgi:hypothetical protein